MRGARVSLYHVRVVGCNDIRLCAGCAQQNWMIFRTGDSLKFVARNSCPCYTPSVKLPISWTGQIIGLYSCPFHDLGESLSIFCPVHEPGTTNLHITCIKILRGQKPNLKRNIQICPVHEVGRKRKNNRPVREMGKSIGQFMKWAEIWSVHEMGNFTTITPNSHEDQIES
jgi:hypothetical protein